MKMINHNYVLLKPKPADYLTLISPKLSCAEGWPERAAGVMCYVPSPISVALHVH